MRRTKAIWTKIISVFITLTMMVSLMNILPVSNTVNAATTLTTSQIVSYFESMVGKSWGEGLCLNFVRVCFQNLGVPYSSANCAYEYGSSFIDSTSKDNIPIGADVFFTGPVSLCGVCNACGNSAGHVGVYVGDGYIIHAYSGKVQKHKIDTVVSHGYVYRGWGYHANITVINDSISTPTTSKISIPKTEYSLGETIKFTFSSDTATYYTIGIDNSAGRYKTEGTSSTSYSISTLPSGSYSAYVTASNSVGGCDSSRVNFTVGINATLNANGGRCSTASKRVVNGLTYGTLPNAGKTGYTFAGWYTAQTGGTQVLSSTKVTATTNHTLYAHWTANPVTVTLNANGGSVGTASKTVTYNSTYGTLSDPTRTGYTFAGWYTSKEGGTKVTSSTTVSNASAHTLYAHWTANPYTIAYNANGGTGTMSIQSMKYDRTANLTVNAFTRTGYTFAGWNTKADSSGTFYADKASVKNLAASGTVTLYARWTANKYTVKFEGNGADELSTVSKEVTYNGNYGELPQPKREGYNFIGWYTKAEGGTLIASDTKVSITGTQTLYAQWSVNKFLITFNATGGTSESAQKLVTYDKVYGVLPTAERTGYTFKGWYLDEACTQQITSDTIVALTANQAVYAKWELRRYVITFDATGGTAETDSKQVTYGKTYGVLPSATKDGDEFIGWFTEDGTEITSASIVEIESDATLYAKWASDEVIGDVNTDGVFNVADVVMMQKWLLCAGELIDWQAGDLCEDGRIDVFDLCLMKRLLIEKEGN